MACPVGPGLRDWLLAHLAGHTGAPGPKITELAEASGARPATVGAELADMARAGLVRPVIIDTRPDPGVHWELRREEEDSVEEDTRVRGRGGRPVAGRGRPGGTDRGAGGRGADPAMTPATP